MPNQEPLPQQERSLRQFKMNAVVFGPIYPSQDLHRQTQRVLKGHSSGRDVFTDITLHDAHQRGGMVVDYTMTASSRRSAERTGAVYLSQLCDLLSVVTQLPVRFYMPDEDSRDERIRTNRRATTIDGQLTEPEWAWITGNLVFLRREHPRFMAAASWYRKGLIGSDSLDDFCCFWRVIERLAYSYADKSEWSDEDKKKPPVKKCVSQLTCDLFQKASMPEVFADPDAISQIVKLRNDLSHGNIPITPEIIDTATSYLEPLEDAAFAVLNKVRLSKLVCESPT